MAKLRLTKIQPAKQWGYTVYPTYNWKGKFIGYAQVENGKAKARRK
jgi:hypothetical protein